MNTLLKTCVTSLLALFVCTNICFAQAPPQAAMKLKATYIQLKIYPGSKPKKLAYLKSFPGNKQQFAEIFQNGPLHSEYVEYLDFFISMARDFPAEVVDKAVDIGKDMTYDAGVGKQMQLAIVQLGVQHPKEFAAKVKALPGRDIDNLTKFLADAEDHKKYTEYQALIDVLDKINEVQLADKLIDARVRREKEKH
ncbi:hypothetical protein [Mucilaginibacter sp.]|jgi:hypothetical protein|uniref:hypothetical protein n=1 Tax=Mucilaginibacter sp. TaxID=1882438 RepID=UPI002B540E5F|nr:hypothetical protein [Mucilaginibacter sp.]HTI59866.1 hypothetical protein [Mucilaginibacter sp.]